MIKGVAVKKLKLIADERGRLMEILRSDDAIFKKFGQAYITTAYPKVVKAWHYHKKQTDSFACVKGRIRLVLFDRRRKSPTYGETNEFFLSLEEARLVQIPPMVLHGFKCISKEEAMVINIPSRQYNRKNPDEYRIDCLDNNIPYDWRE